MNVARGLTCLWIFLFLAATHAAQVDPLGQIEENFSVPSDGVITMHGEPPPNPAAQALAASPSPTNNFQASDDTGWLPPDAHGAVGPNHLVVMHNGRVRIQNRSGTVLSTTTLNNWWSPAGTFEDAFDPRVVYDPYEGRWIAVAVSDAIAPTSAVLVGVSQGSDPSGSWYKHKFDGDASNATWADYPTIGFNKRWVVVQVNMFSTNEVQQFPFIRSRVYIFNKTNLYAGGTSRTVTNLNNLGGTQVPAVVYDTNINAMYLAQTWAGNGTNTAGQRVGTLRLYTITGNTTNPVVTATTNFPSSTKRWTNIPPVVDFARQSNTTVRIACNDSRMHTVIYRNSYLWCTHTVFAPPTSVTRSGIQWWQIVPTNGAVVQVGRIEDTANVKYYAFPSIGVNRFNDVLIGFSLFSSNHYASGPPSGY